MASPFAAAIHPTRPLLLISRAGIARITTAQQIDPETGKLTQVGGVTFSPSDEPRGIAISPDGNSAYVANELSAGKVHHIRIEANGTLTAGLDASAQNSPTDVVVAPSGRFAYAVNNGSNSVTQYSIGSDGALTHVADEGVSGGFLFTDMDRLVLDPEGNFMYLSSPGTGRVPQVGVDTTTGAVASLSPGTVSVGAPLHGVYFHAPTDHLYAFQNGSNDILRLPQKADGTLDTATTMDMRGEPTGARVVIVHGSVPNVTTYRVDGATLVDPRSITTTSPALRIVVY